MELNKIKLSDVLIHTEQAKKRANAYTDAQIAIEDARVDGVEEIAKGAQVAVAYSNYSAFVTAFNAKSATAYKLGQNIYIVTADVPDLWVSSVEETSVPYTYVDDATIVNALRTTGYIQVGYYKVSMLETAKVNMPTENWTFITENNETVVKKVVVLP